MTNIDKILLTRIENTSNYGTINDNITFYDDQRILNQYLLNFRLSKIRCWSEKNVGLSGIRLTYKNRITSQEQKTIDVLTKDFSGDETEISFDSNEAINEVTIWKDEALRGFEIKTNRGKEKKFGWCGEGQKVELDEFQGDRTLVGFFLGFHKKEGILSMGFYYINKDSYYLLLYQGIFMLRVKLKKEEFKNKVKEKLSTMNYSDKALYYACCLPDNPFFCIFKYIFD
jgi:hypothetical protein